MQALVLRQNADIRLESRPTPRQPADGWVLLRVCACGVCGSDIPRVFGGKAYHYPLIPGHEFSAHVEDPAGSARFEVGSTVAVFPLIPDQRETLSQVGEYALTSNYDYLGSRRDGGFSEYVWAPEANLVPIPDNVETLHAALTEPAAVALHGVRKAFPTANDIGLVIGGGPIGVLAGQWLRIMGCRTVLLSEPDSRKRAIAADVGLQPIDPSKGVEAQIRERTDGLKPTVVVEACGLPETFVQAIEATAPLGRVVFMGNISGEFRLSEKQFSRVLRNELTILGTWNSKITPRGTDEWTTVLAHMDRDLYVAPLISHRCALADGPTVLNSMADKSMWYHKVLFDMRSIVTSQDRLP